MPAEVSPRRFTFGRFELRPAEGRLFESGKPVVLGTRALELLVALVERSGLATKSELLQRVWPGVVVEENSLQAQISALRKLLGPESILTVSGRGYRFALDVVAIDAAPVELSHEDNLPTAGTSFVGRLRESAEIGRLLSRARLLTVVGAGGCGKTRLAVQVATNSRVASSRGIWFVELATLSDGALIAQRLAAVLGVVEQPAQDLVEQIVQRLESKPALIILDNAEHLLSACGQLVDELLTRSSRVSFLVTSREQLAVSGEFTYRVPSLSVPDASQSPSPQSLSNCESVQLFVERARILRPHFSVDESNAALVAAICSRLDGIPLAIELAAPRVRTMSLEEIHRRLDRRFSLLTDGSNTSIPRQRTLRSMIDWSFELLTPIEQAVFCRASVFSGGWDLESAERVCIGDGADAGDMLDVLMSLVDKHLITTEQKHGLTRYRMLETMRQYALDRLREVPTTFESRSDLHLSHFAALCQLAEPGMLGPDQVAWFDRLEVDHDNLRAALSWSLGAGANPVAGLTLAGSVWRFWFTRGHMREGRAWLSRLVDAAPVDAPQNYLAKVLTGSGALAFVQADLESAGRFFEGVLQIRRAMGDRRLIGGALNNLAAVVHGRGDLEGSKRLFQESLGISKELGDGLTTATGLHNLGDVARDQKDFESSQKYYEESLALNRQLALPAGVAGDLAALGVIAAHQGDYVAARSWLLPGLAALWQLQDRWRVSTIMGELAMVAASMGLIDRAATMWGAAESFREEIGAPLTDQQLTEYEDCVTTARRKSGDVAAFEATWREGGAMGWERAVQYVLAPAQGWEVA